MAQDPTGMIVLSLSGPEAAEYFGQDPHENSPRGCYLVPFTAVEARDTLTRLAALVRECEQAGPAGTSAAAFWNRFHEQLRDGLKALDTLERSTVAWQN